MNTQQQRWILSGGLASGKSQVREVLEEHGVFTIDADKVGHEVLEPDGPAYSEVIDRWPQVVREGEIHRPSLASIVFGNTTDLAALEKITHPHIFDRIHARVEGVMSPVVVEIPLLAHHLGDGWKIIVVDSKDEIRLQRAIERGMRSDDAEMRMRVQPRRGGWLAAANAVIPNHGTAEELNSTVTKLVPKL